MHMDYFLLVTVKIFAVLVEYSICPCLDIERKQEQHQLLEQQREQHQAEYLRDLQLESYLMDLSLCLYSTIIKLKSYYIRTYFLLYYKLFLIIVIYSYFYIIIGKNKKQVLRLNLFPFQQPISLQMVKQKFCLQDHSMKETNLGLIIH